jgi:hypothetical protein
MNDTMILSRNIAIPSEEHLAKLLCVYNGIEPISQDGSPQWWVFSDTAKQMLSCFNKKEE